jgi:RNA polymerase sigma-70 factor, ECF subfamily
MARLDSCPCRRLEAPEGPCADGQGMVSFEYAVRDETSGGGAAYYPSWARGARQASRDSEGPHLRSTGKALRPTRAPGTGAADSTPDETLVDLALDGHREAFELLVRRHQKPLLNYLHRLTGARDGAMDLAQEVFIKVYVSLSSFDPKYRFTTWLYRIASNCAIDQMRKKQLRTYAIDLGQGDCDRVPADSGLCGHDPTPDEVLRLREIEGRLDKAIAALPVAYRQLILLRHKQHCRYDEIARITRLPIGTVKNRIFRAREMLKCQLADVLEPGY